MGVVTAPRSVSDATRFTATTPHASSKAASPAASSAGTAGPGSRFSRNAQRRPGREPAGGSGGNPVETPDQRVARLRAAHQRAKAADSSKMDKVIAGGRRFFDTAHKVTVMGLIGFTAIAGLVTAYTAYDMITFNRKRKQEFIEAQMKLEVDSLEAARLAYMTKTATEEQIALVEEALEREGGISTSGPHILSKLPGLVSAPIPLKSDAPEKQSVTEAATWPGSAESEQVPKVEQPAQKKSGGMFGWFSSSKGDVQSSSQERLGFDSLGEEDKQAYLRAKAREAFEREKENQRNGGSLDQLELDKPSAEGAAESQPPKKKGWLW